MPQFYQSDVFSKWLHSLDDRKALARILARLRSAELGNFGDSKSLGSGLYEMRVHTGPGYRIYYTQVGQITYLLLAGGDKASQTKDIRVALRLMNQIRAGMYP